MGMIDRVQRWLTRDSNTDPAWYALLEAASDDLLGGGVSELSALRLTAVLGCVRILSNSVAMLPLHVYRRGAGGKQRADDHPVALVLREPGGELSEFELRRLAMVHVLLWGNAYLYIDQDGRGQVRGLAPLLPWRMQVEWKGQPVYTYWTDGQQNETIPASRLLHVRGLTTNGYLGMSVIGSLMQEVVSANLAMQRYGRNFFANGARPGGVLEHPSRLGDDAYQKIARRWQESYGGTANANKTAILEEGMKYSQITIPNDEAQFLESRQYGVVEIARAFGVPPHLLGDLTKSSYASVEQLGIEFVQYSLQPWLTQLEQAIGASLFTEQERQTYYAEHVIDGLLRGDSKTRYEAYSIGIQNGWLNRNEVRQLENLNPVDGLDEYLAPLNMTTAGAMEAEAGRVEEGDVQPASAPAAPTPPARSLSIPELRALLPPIIVDDFAEHHEERAEEGDDDDDGLAESARVARKDRQQLAAAYVVLFQDVARRLVKREAADLRRSMGRIDAEYLEQFYRALQPVIPSYFEPVMRSAVKSTLAAVQREMGNTATAEQLQDFVSAYLASLAAAWCDNSRNQLQALIRDAANNPEPVDVQAALEERIGEWEERRPDKVGSQQAYETTNALAVAAYATMGVASIVWAARGKSCPYCRSLSGKVVAIDRWFVDGDVLTVNEKPMKVYGTRRHGPLHRGCDCVTVARR